MTADSLKTHIPLTPPDALHSGNERTAVRVFIEASVVMAFAVVVTLLALVEGLLTSPLLTTYCAMLLWALAVVAYSFFLLLKILHRLREDLNLKSFVDELTGVFNFRYLCLRLIEEQERLQRHGGPTAVLFLDLDHFKDVNYRYGHPTGNIVLKDVATGMKEHVRASDILGRLGGDEFLVIIPQANQDQAVALAERLRTTVERYQLKLREKECIDFVRVSVGVAVYPRNSDSLEGVVMAADRAVYQAKDRGGNQVCVAEQFFGTPEVSPLSAEDSVNGDAPPADETLAYLQ